MLGIFGTGGIGKTTLAKVLFNSISNQFEGACFLFNVRKSSNQDNGKVHLQQMLLSEMLEDGKIELGSVEKGIAIIKDRLSTKRVLIVLDDVDKIEQLKELAGGCDWFGTGSRIIITTRDRHLLVAHQVKRICALEVLNDHESLELFCHNAFKKSSPVTNYEDLSNRAIRYAKGLPLALKVIGSNLIGKGLNEWKSALDKYEKNPHRDIQSILRISYDSLESNERDIFLDIACFFNGHRLEYVKRILDGCEFYTDDGIRILVDKSLITLEDGYLRMHDLINDMAREIVYQEAPKEAGERSRLWFPKDILEVLTENTGSSKVEGIKLDCRKEVNCTIDAAFEKMKKLRILIVRNTRFSSGPIYLPNQLRLIDWNGYPSKSFPPGFYPEKIAAFSIRFSPLVLGKPFQKFNHLTYMNFSNCGSITQFPDVSGVKNLRELILNRCRKLFKVDKSVGFLPNLVYLSVSGCIRLQSFLPRIFLPSLEHLSFDLCRRLVLFPDVLGKMDKPLKICIKSTAITELPRSFANLIGLGYLDMTSCKELQSLPSTLFMLPKVVTIKIGGCSQLRESLTRFRGSQIAECWPNLGALHFSDASLSDEDLSVILQSFPNLKVLDVSSNYIVSFPARIKKSICLTSLDVSNCPKLEEIQELPSSVQRVDARHCNSLCADTSSMLWSQVRKEINRLQVVMPRTNIPEWLDCREQGGIPIFWARGKFPVVALALVLGQIKYQNIGLHLFIDGELVHVHSKQYHTFDIAEDHVLLFDLRVLFADEERERLDARVGHGNDWKRVQVKCDTDMILRQWGVYVYKEETNMGDILFTCPDPKLSGEQSFLVLSDRETKSRVEEEEEEEEEEEGIQEDDCSPCCSSILSTFMTLHCFMFRDTFRVYSSFEPPPSPSPTPPLQPPPRQALPLVSGYICIEERDDDIRMPPSSPSPPLSSLSQSPPLPPPPPPPSSLSQSPPLPPPPQWSMTPPPFPERGQSLALRARGRLLSGRLSPPSPPQALPRVSYHVRIEDVDEDIQMPPSSPPPPLQRPRPPRLPPPPQPALPSAPPPPSPQQLRRLSLQPLRARGRPPPPPPPQLAQRSLPSSPPPPSPQQLLPLSLLQPLRARGGRPPSPRLLPPPQPALPSAPPPPSPQQLRQLSLQPLRARGRPPPPPPPQPAQRSLPSSPPPPSPQLLLPLSLLQPLPPPPPPPPPVLVSQPALIYVSQRLRMKLKNKKLHSGEWDEVACNPICSSSEDEDEDEDEKYYSSEDGDEQVSPSFSESLQTVVENLKRVVANRQEKGDGGDDDDYTMQLLADRVMLSDDEEEEEGESE